MHFIDMTIVLGFIAQSIYSGFRSKARASQNLTEYLLAGRSIKGWKAGISMAATQYAADTPLLVTGLIVTSGIAGLWRLWVYALAFLMMGYLLGKAWRKAGVITDAEFTEIRYSGNAVLLLRGLKSIYYGTIINCVVLAMVLVAATRVFEIFLPWHLWMPSEVYHFIYNIVVAVGIPLASNVTGLETFIATTNNIISLFMMVVFVALYSTTGGLRSVIATDIVQFTIMMLATLLYAVIAIHNAGGFFNITDKLVELYGMERTSQMLSFIPSDAILPFIVVISLQWFFQMNSDGTGYLAQRTMACESQKGAEIAGVVFTFAQVLLRSLFWLPIIVALLIIYPFDPSLPIDDSFVSNREMLFAKGINDLLPVGVRGLMITGMLAALASTLDTHLNWGAGYWSNDIYKAIISRKFLKREPRSRELVLVARLSNILILIIALIIMANLGSIQKAWQISLLFGAGTGSVLVLRWLWERINLNSEIAAISSSIFFAPIILFYVPEEWLRLLLMSIISTIFVVGAALMSPPTETSKLTAFYKRVQPPGLWGNSAARAGMNPLKSRYELIEGIKAILLTGATCFLLLTGIGKLIVPIPNASLIYPVLLIAGGLICVPFWLKKLLP
jgi:Na+/proline symporter